MLATISSRVTPAILAPRAPATTCLVSRIQSMMLQLADEAEGWGACSGICTLSPPLA